MCLGTMTALCPPPVFLGGNGLLCSEYTQSIFIRPHAFVSLSVSSNRVQIGKEEGKKSGCCNLLSTSPEIMAATSSPGPH